MTNHLRKTIVGYLLSLVAIVTITVFYLHEPGFAITTVVLSYLLMILVVSALYGLGVSVFMSTISTLVLDYYFFPPVGRFTISDPQDWASLFAFLITSVIGSELSARARRQAAEANRRRNEVEQLYKFSNSLLKARDPEDLLNEIPKQIVGLFKVSAAALFLSDKQTLYRSGVGAVELDRFRLGAVAASEHAEVDRLQDVTIAPVHLGSRVIGSFGVIGSVVSHQTLEAMGTLIANAIDRALAIELLGKAEAVREGERLKSVLLDAITHDFKTPLTSIKASATSLLEDLKFNKKQRKELLIIIDEECDRINRLIGETGDMARLETGGVTLQFTTQTVGELISSVLTDCEDVQSTRPIQVNVDDPQCRVWADSTWVRKVFDHLIRNADLYSSPGEPITIEATGKDGFVSFRIVDTGPGIEQSELNLIFDRFYRGKGQRHRTPGTGMGLPIAKAIIEAHGGTIKVISQQGHGSVFTFNLPVDESAEVSD